LPRGYRLRAKQRPQELRLALALQPPEAEHFARPQLKRSVAQLRPAQALGPEDDLVPRWRRGRLADLRGGAAADHHVDQVLLGHVGQVDGPDRLPVAQYRGPIAQGKHFMKPVRDENDEDALVAQLPHQDRKSTRLNSSHGKISY